MTTIFFVSCKGEKSSNGGIYSKTYEELADSAIVEFLEFAKVPRPGFHLDKARAYLSQFAERHNFEHSRDDYGNFWMDIPATKGMEDYPKVILQGHMDMICAAEPGLTLDFEKEVGTPIREGNIIKGERMNLGADNGIGVGIMLAFAKSNVAHGPIRCLITADEDQGLYGAINLPAEVLDADYLINIDEEKVKYVTIASLGGYRFFYEHKFTESSSISNPQKVVVDVKGLKGGHSGNDIAKHRLSAMTIMKKIFCEIFPNYDIQLISISSGTAFNAIATNLYLAFACTEGNSDEIKLAIESAMSSLLKEYPEETTAISKITKGEVASSDYLCDVDSKGVIKTLFEKIPQGIIDYSTLHKGMVDKSNNIGIVTLSNGEFTMKCYSRSYDDDYIKTLPNTYKAIADGFNIGYKDDAPEPSWETSEDLPLIQLVLNNYREIYGNEAQTSVSTGGLECGYFSQKRPTMQIISMGPTITDAHTINEALYTETVEPVIRTLVKTLHNIKRIESLQ